jgi:DNA-binding response OmpR family regulator
MEVQSEPWVSGGSQSITETPSEKDGTRRPGHIMVVERDDLVRKAVALLVGMEGCQVKTSDNWRSSIEIMKEWPTDLIFLETRIPREDTFVFVKTYIQEVAGTHAPIVLLTDELLTPETALDLGAAGSVQKPVNVSELVAIVKRYAPCS